LVVFDVNHKDADWRRTNGNAYSLHLPGEPRRVDIVLDTFDRGAQPKIIVKFCCNAQQGFSP
jgi:hypothetical protein